jgi:hypothetical protein
MAETVASQQETAIVTGGNRCLSILHFSNVLTVWGRGSRGDGRTSLKFLEVYNKPGEG